MLDVHCHAFHPKIAEKVIVFLEEHYGIPAQGTGLKEDLKKHLKEAGFSKAVVLCAATGEHQVIPANNWAISLKEEPEFIPFGSLHPDYPNWPRELRRLKKHKIRGIKLHPDFQGFDLSSPKLYPLLEEIGEDFWLLVHVGDNLPPEKNPSSPYKLAKVLKDFPGLKVIAAHLGGYLHWPEVLEHLVGKEVFLDISSTLPFIAPELLREILQKHPQEKILFGSDYPLFLPGQERQRILEHPLLGEKFWQKLEENSKWMLENLLV
ncbi:MAG TPA: amidohydrolase [Desulfonauticus sp.]|nr:MAG: Amidohydrolase 2 [Desulfonauticus sp. 38_4375]HCO12217.1 amidohydrolase [Desulfonauticus sp.]